mgnify:FL=1
MRTAMRIIVVLLALCLTAAAESESPYRQTQNVIYGETDGVGLLMDVFAPTRPDGPGHGLGLICVTSGAWKSDRAMMEAHQRIGIIDVPCGHGFTVFAVRPGCLSGFTAVQMLAHVKTGIRYVKAHASEYGIDPDRLGLTGASAGGHLALLAGMCVEPPDPDAEEPLDKLGTGVKAVGVFCPATDFLDWNGKKYGLDLMEWRLVFRDGATGTTEAQKEEAAKAVSPFYQVKAGLPPFLLVHGDADTVIPVQQSIKLAKALRDAGNSAELIVKQGADHSWPTMREEFEKMTAWFDGKL